MAYLLKQNYPGKGKRENFFWGRKKVRQENWPEKREKSKPRGLAKKGDTKGKKEGFVLPVKKSTGEQKGEEKGGVSCKDRASETAASKGPMNLGREKKRMTTRYAAKRQETKFPPSAESQRPRTPKKREGGDPPFVEKTKIPMKGKGGRLSAPRPLKTKGKIEIFLDGEKGKDNQH